MEARELRIGNWIKGVALGKPIKVDSFFFHELYDHEQNDDYSYMDWYTGIPLTPEILEKAGFKKDSDFNFLYLAIGILDFWQGKDGSVNLSAGGGHEYHICEIKYVHQLQNLYFFLTSGEELNIEL